MAELSPALRAELEEVYRDVERSVEQLGVVCWVRQRCCDFERTDHVLYASSVEVAYVREKHGAGALRAEREALCPFWVDGLCTERERRPLGCRTYFCDARYREALEAIYEAAHQRLQKAAAEAGCAWAYAPFVAQLRSPDSAARDA